MPIDYFYSHNDMEWRNRKIQIGRRSGRFEVGTKLYIYTIKTKMNLVLLLLLGRLD